MLQRFMLIGVGGSGGQVLRRTWNETLLRLKATPGGWTTGMPRCWEFLHIDVPENPDGLDDPSVPTALLDDSCYLGLAKRPRDAKYYFDDLTQPQQRLEWTADWHPDPDVVPEPWKGGGQRRLAGNMISLVELERIRERLHSAARRLVTDDAKLDLQKVSRAFGDNSNALRDAPPRVILVSSLSGGAGSGSILNVAEVLRTCAVGDLTWVKNSIGVYLAPDVFQFDGAKSGLEPNALAAISEMVSAYVSEGPHTGDDANILRHGAGALALTGRRAPEWNFLVGRGNGEVTFDNERDVYGALGRCLTTILTDPVVLDQFESKVLNNWDGQPVSLPVVDLHGGAEHQRNPFSALGYASVGLGRTRFAQYGAERLARRVVDQLLEGHTRYKDPDRPLAGEALTSAVANQHEARFFEASGVWEEDAGGEKHDQVLDALRDRDDVTKRLDELKRSLGTGMPKAELNRKNEPNQWMNILIQRIEEKRLAFSAESEGQRLRNARRWVDEIQIRILDETAKSIGTVGIPVTVELLHRLGAQLERAAVGLERDQRERLFPDAQRALDKVKSFFTGLGEKVITGQHPSIEQAATSGTVSVSLRTEADTYSLAAALMRDLRNGFIAPLEQALSAAASDLTHMRHDHERSAALIRSWSPRSVPERLKPAKNELLLDQPGDYPEILDRLLVSTFRTDGDTTLSGGHEGSESLAVGEIVSGIWPRSAADREMPHQHLIAIDQYWQCEVPDVNPSAAPQRARFSISLEPEKLFDRSESWVRNRPGALHDYVKMTLGDELATADNARRNAFVDSVSRMLSLGRPFATVSDDALRAFHGNNAQVEFTRIITPLPVGPDNPARQDLERVLINIGQVDANRIQEHFDATLQSEDIGVVSFITGSVHPFVFSSLTSSIRVEWNQCGTDLGAQRAFWRFRRARSLPGFVPASPSVMRAMTRGFLTARILGYLPDREPDQPFKIWSEHEWLNFPPQLLGGTPRHASAALAPLLESLVLAWLYAGSNNDWTKAYRALVHLGGGGDAPDGAQGLGEGQYLHPSLEHWVQSGDPLSGTPAPIGAVTENAGGTVAERRDAVRKVLEATEQAYASLDKPRVVQGNQLEVDRRWGIRDLVRAAVEDLVAALEGVALPDGYGPIA